MSGKRRGFTVVELLVSLTMLSFVLAGMFSVVVRSQRDYTNQRELLLAQENLRVADLMIQTVLRSAGADPRSTGQALLDPDPENTNGWDNVRVRSDFNPPDGSFDDPLEDVRIRVLNDTLFVSLSTAGSYEPFATHVRSIRFEWYDENGNQITDEAKVGDANRIRFVLEAPPNPIRGDTPRREHWVFLRNRR